MTEDHAENTFSPPLWRQRRTFILEQLLRFRISSVVDYGCGEASVLSILVQPSEPPILRISGLDLDRQVLEEAILKCAPWKVDYNYRRTDPLSIDIYHGSIDVIDGRLEGHEAFVCSEVIEHVHNEVLDRFFPVTLGHYRPKILIVTTPNGEYNVNFPNLKYGTTEATFRHDDHKFEWTREEFESWCHQGAKKYGYSLEFHGIGLLKDKQHDLSNGHCTQACVFIRKEVDTTFQAIKATEQQPHTLIKHIEFPFYDDPPLSEEELMNEVESYIETLSRSEDYMLKSREPCSKPPTPPPTEPLEWKLEWSKDTIQEDLLTFIPQVEYTTVPLQFPVEALWEILRIRQICRIRSRLLSILQSYDSRYYEVIGDNLVVKKAFVTSAESQADCSYSSQDEEDEDDYQVEEEDQHQIEVQY